MADFQFISPSVKFNIKDLTYNTSSVGITTAGLAGETPKGPAFQPVPITSKTQFQNIFGTQSQEKLGSNIKYLLPYYANAYLTQSNQLNVTRILGLSGYAVGPGWGIKISAGLDTSTLVNGSTTTGISTFTNTTFSGATVVAQTGVTFTIQPTYIKTGSNFSGTLVNYQVQNFTSTTNNGLTGTVVFSATSVTGSAYAQYENMVVAVLRTRGRYIGNSLIYNTSNVTINATGATTNPYGVFTLNTTGTTNVNYTCSLNPSSAFFLPKVIGSAPKDKNTQIFVESIYPNLLSKLQDAGYSYGISAELVQLDTCHVVGFNVPFQTPVTPWIVSELRGSTIERLFQFISISDGDSANKEVKISISNINPDTNEFDVMIRDFNDTDAQPVILESFTRCSMNPQETNFIGARIGDNGVNFDNVSQYVYLNFVDLDNFPTDAFPCGFEGYELRSYASSFTCGQTGLSPKIYYKTSYNTSDKLARTYLGVSERGYDTTTSIGSGIDQNLFNYPGNLSASATTKTNGFHFDSGATGTYSDGTYVIGKFDVGVDELRTSFDTSNPSNAYYNKQTRKFTLVPYGGFDGWDIYADSRTNTNPYKIGGIYYSPTSDYYAYLQAYNSFSNKEEVAMNVFATPGIDWSTNSGLVDEVVDMISTVRMDSIYLIDSPNLNSDPDATTFANDIADLINSTDLDTAYAATYAPWIQQYDQVNGLNVYIPPTGEVLKAIALTDNSTFPWFAPAGLTRGLINAKRAQYRLTEPNRDTLYAARINPIADFANVGVDIFGQKTLQIKDSALNRINVIRLILYMQQVIANIAKTLLFDPNDDTVIQQFLNKVNPILTTIKRERGLNDFQITYQDINTPTTQDNGQLLFNMYIKPTRALEYIGINFIVTPTGVQFQTL